MVKPWDRKKLGPSITVWNSTEWCVHWIISWAKIWTVLWSTIKISKNLFVTTAGFILICIPLNLPDGRGWLRGKLGLVLMGGAMLISVQFSCSVVSDSLRPHELQHTRPPCPSPTPEVHPNSCPSSWWCHPAISSCRLLLLLPPSLPASESFPASQFFTWGGQSIGALASALPKNTQDWSPLG